MKHGCHACHPAICSIPPQDLLCYAFCTLPILPRCLLGGALWWEMNIPSPYLPYLIYMYTRNRKRRRWVVGLAMAGSLCQGACCCWSWKGCHAWEKEGEAAAGGRGQGLWEGGWRRKAGKNHCHAALCLYCRRAVGGECNYAYF